MAVALLAALGFGIYMAIVWVPLYADDYSMREAIQSVANSAWRNVADDELKKQLMEKAKRIRVYDRIVDGKQQDLPAIVLLADNIFITRDQEKKEILIQVTYERDFVYPIVGRPRSKTFTPSATASLTPVQW